VQKAEYQKPSDFYYLVSPKPILKRRRKDWGVKMASEMWKRYIAEFIGTFSLVMMGTGVRAMVGGDTKDFAGILLVHLTFGLTICVMIYSLSHLSGAHFNPSITLGFAVSRIFPWRYVLPYWLAQFLGATAASALQLLLFPGPAIHAHFGATIPHVGIGQALGIEALLTFFLMFANMALGTDKCANWAIVGFSIGFVVLASGLFGNFLTGGSMNPARSLGPALFAGGPALSNLWIYFVGPFIGAIIAALVYQLIRESEKYLRGAPESLLPLARGDAMQKAKSK
jgi:MIP family channel proteins